ncbi:MAG: LacI family DNA-binding transcriptional regulator, partial [Demequina sp.]|nr:LacI family DNA-binding transcriptional regulator [Demequina sp.]
MDTPGRVKLADVAARAGVSVATVSKVVNGRYGVAKQTIATVQEVIDDLGYVGNLGASGLRNSRTNVVGILVADFEPYSSELIKGAA